MTAVTVGAVESGLAGVAPLTVIQCAGCGVQSLHPQPSDELLKQAYSPAYYGRPRTKFVGPVARLVRLFQSGRASQVAKYVHSGSRILDIGCGNGGFLQLMRHRGYTVEGTEWSHDAAARVPSTAGLTIHVGDLLELDLTPHAYDAITLWHVLEHLRQPRETLHRIHDLLKPGGHVFMSMPNVESDQALRYGVHWLHLDPPRHLFGFGPHSIALLLEDSGFHLRHLSTWSFEQNPFGEIQSHLNAAGYPRDRLYGHLKGLDRAPLLTRLTDMMWMACLLPLALVRDVMESSRGRGATMTVIACR